MSAVLEMQKLSKDFFRYIPSFDKNPSLFCLYLLYTAGKGTRRGIVMDKTEQRDGFTRWGRLGIMASIGFFLGRVWLFQINPFGVAFFAAMCAENRGKKSIALAVIIGMLTSADGMELLKYIMLFSLVLTIQYIQEKMGKGKLTPLLLAALCGGINLLLGTVLSILALNTWEMFWLSILESFAILALANVYQWGVRYFLFEEWWKALSNEELISSLVLVFTALYGIPDVADSIFSVTATISYFLVLFMGYRYGAATGAVTGAAGGVLAALSGGDMVQVGIYCLLGVSVGMFRMLGKIGSTVTFGIMGCVLTYVTRYDIVGIVELRAMVSAVILFLAIPRNIIHIVESDIREQDENPFAREDIRELANDRIEDFSNAFRRLSRSFEKGKEQEKEVPQEEVERIFEELSRRVCSDCANCNFCWDKHYEETSENMHNILWQAGRDGVVSVSKLTPEFGRRCIRLATFVEHAEERMAVAKQNLGWRNRMAENREIMARQMSEVAAALKSFTLDLEEADIVSSSCRREMIEELKKEGVRIKRLTAKRRGGQMEVAFSGYCRGNQCLTKTDIAKALSRAAGVTLCPGRETRNVLSGEEMTMFFREDTKLRAITGVARMAKSGETVSGDNYSFLELQTGELVMVLVDGMGSGEFACRDSVNLLEVLEHLIEAGFEKKSALRLLNTLFVANYEGESFAALDMVAINLHDGKCEIFKNGAAATYIRRSDRVETITSEALPVGVTVGAESDEVTLSLQEGDMVIMVSDGVMDSFYSSAQEEKESLEDLIFQLPCQNPSDLANQILMHALARSDRAATDDMSVLAAGIWNKN